MTEEELHPDTKRILLIREVIDFFSTPGLEPSGYMCGNSLGWVDVSRIIIKAIAGQEPGIYFFSKKLAIYQKLKKNPELLGKVRAYVNSYGKEIF